MKQGESKKKKRKGERKLPRGPDRKPRNHAPPTERRKRKRLTGFIAREGQASIGLLREAVQGQRIGHRLGDGQRGLNVWVGLGQIEEDLRSGVSTCLVQSPAIPHTTLAAVPRS